MRVIAIIGTAGRDHDPRLIQDLWTAMKADLRSRIGAGDVLISGGAAWADHLAVHAYLEGWCAGLQLKLPAPLRDGRYEGAFKNAGATANYYHGRFGDVIGEDTLAQVGAAIARGAVVEAEPRAPGLRAMFVRNAKIAQACTAVIAYTFGEDGVPGSSGTLDTWRQIVSADKVHVSLADLARAQDRQRPLSRRERFGVRV